MFQEIYIIEQEEKLTKVLKELFKDDKNFKFKSFKLQNLDSALKNIPELIIINEDLNGNTKINKLCEHIRNDEDNSITPIAVFSSNSDSKHVLSIIKNSVEYFIDIKSSDKYIYYTIKNIMRLIYVNRRVSPLTGLPGNLQIQTELKKRLLRKEDFSVLYFDLDNFKAYNDVYGFLKGDEIIKLTARIISKNINNSADNDVFIGHIGGDDFVAVLDDKSDFEKICQNIIAEFDIEILKHFNDLDIERGYIEVQNRKNVVEQFPLTSISIGVVLADNKRFSNILEIGEVAGQVKHLAKTTMGSCYAIDRRN